MVLNNNNYLAAVASFQLVPKYISKAQRTFGDPPNCSSITSITPCIHNFHFHHNLVFFLVWPAAIVATSTYY